MYHILVLIAIVGSDFFLTSNGSGYASSLTRYAVRYDRYSHCYVELFYSVLSNLYEKLGSVLLLIATIPRSIL